MPSKRKNSTIPPWEPPKLVIRYDRLPPLPPILDSALRSQVFTHKTYVVYVAASLGEDLVPLEAERRSYKQLETRGDAALHHLVVEVLVKANPGLISSAISVSSLCFLCFLLVQSASFPISFGSLISSLLLLDSSVPPRASHDQHHPLVPRWTLQPHVRGSNITRCQGERVGAEPEAHGRRV